MRRLLPLLLAAAAAPAAAQNTNQLPEPKGPVSDWEREQRERNWQEREVKLPPPPKAESLIEFFPSATSSFRFFVDAASLSVSGDGVVRYTLVARSASGYENVSYEGIRCASNSFKIYAYANEAAWSRTQTEWRSIEPKSVQRWHNELRSRYFCPLRLPILSVAEGVDALRRGGHPLLPNAATSR